MERTSRDQSNSLKNNWGTMFKGIGIPAAGALAAYIALHAASSRGLTKHQIVPFKGHRLPTLAFAACSAAAFALGHAYTGPYRSPIEPPPEDLKEKEEGEGRESSSSIHSDPSNSPDQVDQRDDHESESEGGSKEGDEGSEPPSSPPSSPKSQQLRDNELPDHLKGDDSQDENYLLGIGLSDDSEGSPQPNIEDDQPPPELFMGQIFPHSDDSETQEAPPPSHGVLTGVDVMSSYIGADRKEESRDQETIDALKDARQEKTGLKKGPLDLNAGQVKKVVKAIEAVDRGEHHGLEESQEDAPLIGIVSGLRGEGLLSSGEWKGYLKAPVPQEDLVAPTSPGVYAEKIHGPGGINIRQMNYSAFMLQYASRFEEAYGKSVQEAYAQTPKGSLEELTLGYLRNLEIKPVSKERYVEFCQAHRKLLESGPPEEALKIAGCIAWARFMPNVQEFHNNSIKEHIENFPKEITAENFHKVMKDMNVAVDSSPQEMRGGGENLQKIKLYGELSLCNYFEVNPQTLRNQETWVGPDGEKRTIYHLRHATPNAYHYLNEDDPYGARLAWDLGWAAGTSDYYTKIDPAYTAFLDFAKEKGEGVLYACHQKINDTQEGKRCRKITELEESGKHPNLLLLFQSVEFPGFMNEAKTFEELKETLKQSFEEGTWNRLPQQVRNDKKYKEELWQVFDEVKKLYYGDQEDIPLGQVKGLYPLDKLGKGKYHPTHTQKMIMLFYHYQREHLKFFTRDDYKYKVTYVNSGCKDNFDRGFANNCTTDQIHEIALYGNKVPEDEGDQSLQRERLIATAASGMGVTLHGKGIGILGYRLAPALLVSKLLGEMDLDADKQEKMKRSAILSGWKLTGCGLPLQPNQPATPLIARG